MSDSKDSYVLEVLVGQVTKSDTCGICLKQKGGNDIMESIVTIFVDYDEAERQEVFWPAPYREKEARREGEGKEKVRCR